MPPSLQYFVDTFQNVSYALVILDNELFSQNTGHLSHLRVCGHTASSMQHFSAVTLSMLWAA